MVYRITVDGKRTYAETSITGYSTEKDREAREKITRHFQEVLGANEVIFDNSYEEAASLHVIADEFYIKAIELFEIINSFPEDPWGIDEMAQLIPPLMQIYILAMKLPDLEYMEDAKYDQSEACSSYFRQINFAKEYEYYWRVFDPYCKEDLCKNPNCHGGLCQSALWDDLGDTVADLENGVEAYLSGLVCRAIFDWRYSILIHSGRHILNALTAMCRAWEDATEHNETMQYDPKKYWSKDSRSVIV